MSLPAPLHPTLIEAYFDWLFGPEREREARSIEVLEEIKAEYGTGWAIYASAFCHGAGVRQWRLGLIAELDGRQT